VRSKKIVANIQVFLILKLLQAKILKTCKHFFNIFKIIIFLNIHAFQTRVSAPNHTFYALYQSTKRLHLLKYTEIGIFELPVTHLLAMLRKNTARHGTIW